MEIAASRTQIVDEERKKSEDYQRRLVNWQMIGPKNNSTRPSLKQGFNGAVGGPVSHVIAKPLGKGRDKGTTGRSKHRLKMACVRAKRSITRITAVIAVSYKMYGVRSLGLWPSIREVESVIRKAGTDPESFPSFTY